MKTVGIELTESEADVVSEYLLRKCVRLEEAGLTDSKCYPLLYGAYSKLRKAMKNQKSGSRTGQNALL